MLSCLLVGLVFADQETVTVTRYNGQDCSGDANLEEEYTEPCGADYNEDAVSDDLECTCDNIKVKPEYAANLKIYPIVFNDYDECFVGTTPTTSGNSFIIKCGGGSTKTMVILIFMAIAIAGIAACYFKFCSGSTVTNDTTNSTFRRTSVYKGVQMETMGELPPEWTEFKDAEGTPYWHNSKTSETSWFRPQTTSAPTPAKRFPASEKNNWKRYQDAEGTPYWVNSKTSESTWVEPLFEEVGMPMPPPVPAAAGPPPFPKSTGEMENVIAAAKMANDNPEATKAAVNFAKDNPDAAKKAAKWASSHPDTAKNLAGGLAAAFKS